MQRLLCSRCGDSIHPDTASRNAGLCVPCVRGNQLSIAERTKRQKAASDARKAHYDSAEYKYWTALVAKVYAEPNGYTNLPAAERLYYLINVLCGEVHNGGFDQFFSNSSGNRFSDTTVALEEVGAQHSLELLMQAKTILFGGKDVPGDRVVRCEMMPTWEESHPEYSAAHEALTILDKRFYADPDNLGQILDDWAKRHGLYQSDA